MLSAVIFTIKLDYVFYREFVGEADYIIDFLESLMMHFFFHHYPLTTQCPNIHNTNSPITQYLLNNPIPQWSNSPHCPTTT